MKKRKGRVIIPFINRLESDFVNMLDDGENIKTALCTIILEQLVYYKLNNTGSGFYDNIKIGIPDFGDEVSVKYEAKELTADEFFKKHDL